MPLLAQYSHGPVRRSLLATILHLPPLKPEGDTELLEPGEHFALYLSSVLDDIGVPSTDHMPPERCVLSQSLADVGDSYLQCMMTIMPHEVEVARLGQVDSTFGALSTAALASASSWSFAGDSLPACSIKSSRVKVTSQVQGINPVRGRATRTTPSFASPSPLPSLTSRPTSVMSVPAGADDLYRPQFFGPVW
jgi:hypothetical protein